MRGSSGVQDHIYFMPWEDSHHGDEAHFSAVVFLCDTEVQSKVSGSGQEGQVEM